MNVPPIEPNQEIPTNDDTLPIKEDKVTRKETPEGWVYEAGKDVSDAVKYATEKANEDLAKIRTSLKEQFPDNAEGLATAIKSEEEKHWKASQEQFEKIASLPLDQQFGKGGGIIDGEDNPLVQTPPQQSSPDIDDEEEEQKKKADLSSRIENNFVVGKEKKSGKDIEKFCDPENPNIEYLRRKDNKFTFSGKDERGNDTQAVNKEHVKIVVDTFKQEGKTKLKVSGSQDLQYQTWLEGRLAGLEVQCKSFKPKPEHIAALAREANKRGIDLPPECVEAGHKQEKKDSIKIENDKSKGQKDSITIDKDDKKRPRDEGEEPSLDEPKKKQKTQHFESEDLNYSINFDDEGKTFTLTGNVPPQIRAMVETANNELARIKGRTDRLDSDKQIDINKLEQSTYQNFMEIKATHMLSVKSDEELTKAKMLEPAREGMDLYGKVIKMPDEDGPAYAIKFGAFQSSPRIVKLSESQAQGLSQGQKLEGNYKVTSKQLGVTPPSNSQTQGQGRSLKTGKSI